MQLQTNRVQPLDFMRGFAVIVMVMGHSMDSVLSQGSRTADLFRLYDAARGFTAPLFLFISGFAFAVVTLRKWEAFVAFGVPARRRLGKMVMLLGLGYALHFPFFSLNKLLHDTRPAEYAMMFQVDVLHCLAVGLIALQLFVVLARTPRRFIGLTTGAAAVIILASPLIWLVDLSSAVTPFFAPYFNQQVPSIFPFFPFAAYLFTGGVVGMLYMKAREAKSEHLLLRNMFRIGIAVSLVGLVLELQPFDIYPPYDFWKTSPNFFLIRIGIIAVFTSAFFSVRHLPPLVADNLVILGQASLVVYAVHLVLVYGSAANAGLMQIIGQRLHPLEALATAVGVLMVMITLVHVRNTLREHHYYPLRLAQAGFTCTLLYFFLTKPY
jgi:acyltransferase